MGDWYVDRNGDWNYDPDAPSPDPTVTQISMPPIRDLDELDDVPLRSDDSPEYPGGDWANAEAYASYDEVDSTTIDDRGAP